MVKIDGRVVKIEVSVLFGELGGTPETISFSQVGVSPAREATFWILGALLRNPFPSFLQNHRKSSQILTSRNSPDNSDDSAEVP